MTKELDEKLVQKYPKIFVHRHENALQQPMGWGFQCDDGWYWLIDELCERLQFHTKNNKLPQVIATTVKEKFGRLCFYFKTTIEGNGQKMGIVQGIIDFAESLSTHVCEVCGSSSGRKCKTEGSHWYKTVCPDCSNVLNYQQKGLYIPVNPQ